MVPYYVVNLFCFDIYNLYLIKLKIFNFRENIHVDVAKIHSLNCDKKYQTRYCTFDISSLLERKKCINN